MTEHERMTRLIADCLEQHLHEIRGLGGWNPYRYPSGEHKGVQTDPTNGTITLIPVEGPHAVLTVVVPLEGSHTTREEQS